LIFLLLVGKATNFLNRWSVELSHLAKQQDIFYQYFLFLIVLKERLHVFFLKMLFQLLAKEKKSIIAVYLTWGLMADFFLILRMVSLRRFVSSVAFSFYFLVAAGGIILSHLYLSDDVRKMFLNLFLFVSCQKSFFFSLRVIDR